MLHRAALWLPRQQDGINTYRKLQRHSLLTTRLRVILHSLQHICGRSSSKHRRIHCIRRWCRANYKIRRKIQGAIEEINSYERKWKIKTNYAKFQILYISKHNPPAIEINATDIQYSREGKTLGLKLTRIGITKHKRKNKPYQALPEENQKIHKHNTKN